MALKTSVFSFSSGKIYKTCNIDYLCSLSSKIDFFFFGSWAGQKGFYINVFKKPLKFVNSSKSFNYRRMMKTSFIFFKLLSVIIWLRWKSAPEYFYKILKCYIHIYIAFIIVNVTFKFNQFKFERFLYRNFVLVNWTTKVNW